MRELTEGELALIAGGYGYDDEDVVVTGSPYPPYYPPTYPPYFYPPVFPGDYPSPPPPYGGGGGGGGGEPGSPPPPPADARSYDVDTSEMKVPLTPAQQAAVDTLRSVVAPRLASVLGDPSASGTWTSPEGEVRLSELSLRMDYADFRILPDDYPINNGTAALPGAGFADFNGGNPILSIRISDLVGYMASPENQNLYILHELVHVTTAGKAYSDGMYAPGSDGGATRTPAEHNANEAWANSMARAIAEANGLGFPANPSGGFSTSPVTFTR